MASIDELHWSAILDTQDFDKAVTKLRKEAKELNKDLSDMLNIYNRFKGKTLITETGVKNARELSDILTQISQKMTSLPSSVKVYENATKSANKEIERTTHHYTTQSALLRQLSSLAGTYFSVRGVQSFLKSLIDVTGQFEVQKMALTSMLQSSEVADRIFSQYRQMALQSPYTFQDFTKFGKQLTAFNIPAQELIGTTKMLADVAAGLGVDMGRIILAYGQIKSAGVLKGTELRQLTEAGVPILDSLAKQIEETTGKTVKLADVFQMISKKQIPFDMVEKAFKEMTSAGGKFFNMQEVLVETLQGKIGKLRDVWQQMLYDMGRSEKVNDALKGSIDFITRLVSDYETLGRKVAEIIATFGAYKIALVAVEAATGTLTIANHRLLSSLKSIGVWVLKNPYALLAAGVALAAYDIYKYMSSMTVMERQQKNVSEAVEKFNSEMDNEISLLDYLFKNLQQAEVGTKEYDRAKQEILSHYGEYLDAIDQENLRVGDSIGVYEKLKVAIEDAARARALEAGSQEIEKTFIDERTKLAKALKKAAKDAGLNKGEQQELYDYVFRGGALSEKGLAAKKKLQPVTMQTGYGLFSSGGINVDAIKTNYEEAAQAMKDGRQQLADELELIYGVEQKIEDSNKRIIDPKVPPKTTQKENAIKRQIANLQKLKDAYDKLSQHPLVGEENAKSLMESFFGETNLDFEGRVKSLTEELLRLNPELQEYVDGVNASFGKDKVAEYIKSVEALQKYKEFIEKWEGMDFNLTGATEAEREITKIITSYNNKVSEIERRRLEAIKKINAAHKGDKKTIEEETKRVNDLAAAETNYEKKLATDKITDKAKEFFKDATKELDLENWSQKSRREIKAVIDKLKELKTSGLHLSDEEKEKLRAAGINVDGLEDKYSKEVDSAIDKGNNALRQKDLKAFAKASKLAAKEFGELGKELEKIGESAANGKLRNIGSYLSGISDNVEASIEGAEKYGGWWGYIIGGIENAGKQLLEDVAIWKQVVREIESARVDALISDMDKLLEDHNGLLGSSWLQGLKDSFSVMTRMRSELSSIVAMLGSQEIEKTFNSSYLNPLAIETIVDNLIYKVTGVQPNLMARASNQWKAYEEAIKRGYEGAEAYILKTHDRGGFLNAIGWDDKYGNLKDIIEGLGYEMYDKYGNINAKGLQAILDTYTKLGAEDKEWIESAIKYADEYKKAMEQLDGTVKELFGDISSTIADRMIDNFKATGDAVSDLSKAFDEMGESLVSSMLQSVIYETVLKKYEDRFRSLLLDYGKGDMSLTTMLDQVDGIFSNMETDFEKTGDVYNAILEKAKSLDWLGESEDASNLANGIKGITEDTASLLASYINAMRADVSSIRMINEIGWRDVKGILGSIETLPTLNDYLAQVAASNANIEAHTQQIMLDLEAVITSASGRRAFAVDVQ